MPHRRIRSSRVGLAAAVVAVLVACGSETPETVQYPPATPGVAQIDVQSYGSPPPQQPPYDPPQVREPVSVPGSDGTLAAMVESAIAAEPELNTLGIEVSAVEGTVYLRGEARTRETRRLASQVASSVDGVKRVQNELFVLAGSQPEQYRAGELTAVP